MKPDEITFVCDMMVGRLARWLRIFGYDTLYDPEKPVRDWVPLLLEERRVLLTRNRQIAPELPPELYFWVEPNQPDAQIRQVIEAFELDVQSHLFSRCLLCNVPVVPAEKAEVRDKIPPRVWQTHTEFWRCPHCGRVYWQGSHLKRVKEHIRNILADSPNSSISLAI